MKYFLVAEVIIFSLLFLPAHAQNENWDTYMAQFGDKPGSVLVDLGLMAHAPDKKYPFLVVTGPKAQKCNKQGLPDKEEIDELEQILDATNNFLTGVTAKVLVGTFTYNCERLNYYYVKDTIGIRNAIMRMYNRSYKNYSYAINMKPDPEWKTYKTFLYPSDETLTWMENDKIITNMLLHGDSLTTQRDINFDLYFNTDSARNDCADFAINKGYKAKKKVSTKIDYPSYELIVSIHGYVKIDTIDAVTEDLKKQTIQHNGIYNGWEAKQ